VYGAAWGSLSPLTVADMTNNAPQSLLWSVWLVPASPYLDLFRTRIQTLAEPFAAPAFEPHITLFVGGSDSEPDFQRLRALVSDIAASTPPIELVARTTQQTEALFKTLFVEFEPDPHPHALCQRLRDGMRLQNDYVLSPHLSLLYKAGLASAVRAVLAEQNDFVGQRIAFDQLAVVRPSSGATDWSDVTGWHTDQCVGLCALTPSVLADE